MREVPVAGREAQLPLGKRAFDHPGTRIAWMSARRRLRWSLTNWMILCLMLAIALGEFDKRDVLDWKAEHDVVYVCGVGIFFLTTCLFYVRVSSLRCLKRIRKVLEAHPWQLIPAARRPPGAKDVMGVPVQLRFGGDGDGGDEWTGLMSARNPVHRRRWPEAMEQGAWYAGDVWYARDYEDSKGSGVLTLPGGGELMTVTARQMVR